NEERICPSGIQPTEAGARVASPCAESTRWMILLRYHLRAQLGVRREDTVKPNHVEPRRRNQRPECCRARDSIWKQTGTVMGIPASVQKTRSARQLGTPDAWGRSSSRWAEVSFGPLLQGATCRTSAFQCGPDSDTIVLPDGVELAGVSRASRARLARRSSW